MTGSVRSIDDVDGAANWNIHRVSHTGLAIAYSFRRRPGNGLMYMHGMQFTSSIYDLQA